MWGVFFEDINFGADGGLYAEMVKNRGFEFPDPMMGWSKLSPSKARGILSIHDEKPFNAANPHYLRIESEGKDLFGVANEGFRGMGVKKGEAYNFSAQIRSVSGKPALRIELYSSDGALLDTVKISDFSKDWSNRTTVLHPNATDAKAKLYVLMDGKGTVDVDFISLSRKKPGRIVRVVCARTWCRRWRIFIPVLCAFPADALSRAAYWTAVINGRIPSARSRTASYSSTDGIMNFCIARRPIIFSRLVWASLNFSNCARTSAQNRCQS